MLMASFVLGKYVVLALLAVATIAAIEMAIQDEVRTDKDRIQASQLP
jgi:hypothetical protein